MRALLIGSLGLGPVLVLVLGFAPAGFASSQEETRSPPPPPPPSPESLTIESPSLVLTGIPFSVSIKALDAEGNVLSHYSEAVDVSGESLSTPEGIPDFADGEVEIDLQAHGASSGDRPSSRRDPPK